MEYGTRPSNSLNYAYEPEEEPITHPRGPNGHQRRSAELAAIFELWEDGGVGGEACDSTESTSARER